MLNLPEQALRTLDASPVCSGLSIYLADLNHAVLKDDPWGWKVTPGERQRAQQFKDPGLSAHYLLARHVLRELLGHHSGSAPGAIRDLETGPGGKPFVRGLDVSFNMAHSGNLLVVSISADRETGIDIETLPPLETCQACASLALTETERAACFSGGDEGSVKRFAEIWTLKEAILKQSGEGLSRDMREIEFGHRDGQWRLLHLPADYGAPGDWEVGLISTEYKDAVCACAAGLPSR
ncbi:MAG: 4'-phosphopantetheinyl transferase family protein [Opitutales bacterium]|jgi:4'-phosphopantetheinyl transferase